MIRRILTNDELILKAAVNTYKSNNIQRQGPSKFLKFTFEIKMKKRIVHVRGAQDTHLYVISLPHSHR